MNEYSHPLSSLQATPATPAVPERFVALDIHHDYAVVAAVNARQQVVLPPKRLDYGALERWADVHLAATDAVVIEATTNAWYIHDVLTPLVGSVTVANAGKVWLIAKTQVKTDKRDALALAKLHAAGLIDPVWVPPMPVRELRTLIAHRRKLVQQQTRLKNCLHAVLNRHNLVPPAGELSSTSARTLWESLPLSVTERLLVTDDLHALSEVQHRIAAADAELARLSTSAAWADPARLVMQVPGVSVVLAMTLLSAIGDITRFASSKHLASYAGLVPSVHQSGQTSRYGHLTHAGRRELRWALVEAAWSAVCYHDLWQRHFERLCQRMPANKAIVAIAHKLLVVL